MKEKERMCYMFLKNSWPQLKRQLIIIYVVFAAILIGSNVMINFSTLSKGMNKEIANSQTLILGQISNVFDSTMTSIERALHMASAEDCIHNFFENPNTASDSVLSDYSTQNELAGLAQLHSIDSIYLYNKQTGKIISNKNSGDFATFQDKEWIEYCNSIQDTYSWIGPRTIEAYNKTVMSLIRTYPLNSSIAAAKGFIVVNITNAALTQSLQNIPHSSANEFLFLGADKQILFSSSPNSMISQEVLSKLDFSEQSNIIIKNIDGIKKSIFYVTNEKTKGKIVSVCTYNNLMNSITIMRYSFILVFVGTLIILIIAMCFLSKRMYSPIDNLINAFSSRITHSNEQVSLNQIENLFYYTYQKNESLNNQIRESLPGIKWKIIHSILSSTYKNFESLQSELEAINYSFYGKGFAVVLIDIDEIYNLNTSPQELDL